jgi:hypothetical protein
MDGIEPSPYHCTPYSENADPDNFTPCKCPVCGAFLAWDKTGEIPICNNCGAELAKVPKKETSWICCKCQTTNPENEDACSKCGHEQCSTCDWNEDDCAGDGKICVLSPPKWSKEERREKRRQRREQRNLLKKQRLERSRARAQKAIDALNKRLEALS